MNLLSKKRPWLQNILKEIRPVKKWERIRETEPAMGGFSDHHLNLYKQPVYSSKDIAG
jgi:hypothetical protein